MMKRIPRIANEIIEWGIGWGIAVPILVVLALYLGGLASLVKNKPPPRK